MAIIEMNNLTKFYGKKRGIQDVSFSVEKGSMYGFIGPNGAGKSTTIKLLLNLIYPTSGSATIFGLDVVKDSARIKLKTGYVPGEVRFYPEMTAEELLKATIAFHGRDDRGQLEALCDRFEIERHKKMGDMSMGNKKKTAIAAALVHSPELLILDEPTNGLDPLMQKRLFEILKEWVKEGATVLFSSHNLTEVQEQCNIAAFIKEGSIVEIQDLSRGVQKSKIVSLTGKELNFTPFETDGAKLLFKDDTTLRFVYEKPAAALLQLLRSMVIEDICIENAGLEGKFMSMYEVEHHDL